MQRRRRWRRPRRRLRPRRKRIWKNRSAHRAPIDAPTRADVRFGPRRTLRTPALTLRSPPMPRIAESAPLSPSPRT